MRDLQGKAAFITGGGSGIGLAIARCFLGAGMGPCCASKCALLGLSEGLALELVDTGIGVTVLCPGWVNT